LTALDPRLAGMRRVDGGRFLMGSDDHYPEEAPRRPVRVDGFWIDQTPVTNREFAAFVDATGHVTVAERAPDAALYPGADPALLVPASACFQRQDRPVPLNDPFLWWALVPGADWRHPRGPDSAIFDLLDHPVVHIAYADAEAYAAWAGKALPTEAEWECAARAGCDTAYPWGEERDPGGRRVANYWQGGFPWQHPRLPGEALTTAVGSFPPNAFGLIDMIGNVWEWTCDWYGTLDSAPPTSCCVPENPRGTTEAASRDAHDPAGFGRKVLKGGSHLCAEEYCRRYRPAARYAQTVDSSTSHIGFRCVVRDMETAAPR